MDQASDEFTCPRSNEGFAYQGGKAHWREDNTCSYCGSLSEKRFFECVEAGAKLTPTDKNYKVYVESTDKAPLTQTYRDCPPDATCKGPDDCGHWVTRPISQGKFYFQHLSPEGRARFIDLYNQKHMSVAFPGYFYNTPYFCVPVPQPGDDQR